SRDGPVGGSARLLPPPLIDGLEGFNSSDGTDEVAAHAPPPVRAGATESPSTADTAVASYPGAGNAGRSGGLRPPSLWALLGLLPVGVFVGSGVYSTWWRRRSDWY
ncbi:MAG: hypothetical protein ACRDYV_17135, partial [Acidimicrobiia bacterium]